MNTPKLPPERPLGRKDLPALRARWSETVRYEIYLRVGERHDVRRIERAVFEMLLGCPGPVERIYEGDIDDAVSLVCDEYGGRPHLGWQVFLELLEMQTEEDDAP